jgi:TonB family protein
MEMREVIKLSKKEKGSLGTFTKLPEDYYPDYKRGPHTFINVMKHMDAGYFVRLKRVFKLAWDPSGILRGGMLSGEVSRGRIRVVLGLSIDRSGILSELFVINGSGVKGYDKEALRAVRASAPFSTPPKKFLANDGILRISWSFVVYL